jgi:ketosteroid isomerase-like protein
MFRAIGIEDEPETGSKWLKWSAWVAAFIVLVVAPLVWLYMPSHPQSAAPVSQPAPAAAAVPAPTPPPPALARQAGDDPDPAMVVSDWEAAMNSTDAAAQAAFYADPVERYFLRHNLSRDEVKADKQAAINRRRGDWSVKMENVKVTRPDDNTAKARLIKHYTVKEDGKTASEWFVPSLLQMTRANGRWQITSERDLGWATSLEELGY